ncbi:endonuclease [Thalassomonas viridans]|uniref:endonuclease n=1 Tax=Thalassomonas viridans TaxID=137584 RepID=UPI003B67FB23
MKWETKKKLVPVTNDCGYKPWNSKTKKGKINMRAQCIEWEHVVPAWEFGHQLQCWQTGKRKNCAATSPKFQQMEGDLHNLVPAIGEINEDCSNFKYSMIPGETRVYGRCLKGKSLSWSPMFKGILPGRISILKSNTN